MEEGKEKRTMGPGKVEGTRPRVGVTY